MCAPPPAPPEDSPFFQRYELAPGPALGQGSFSVCRRCRHRQSGAEFAVKILSRRWGPCRHGNGAELPHGKGPVAMATPPQPLGSPTPHPFLAAMAPMSYGNSPPGCHSNSPPIPISCGNGPFGCHSNSSPGSPLLWQQPQPLFPGNACPHPHFPWQYGC